MGSVGHEELRNAWSLVDPISVVLQLPLRTQVWRGASGNWAGAGIGSSIDFQDHRPYLPGDDPRYIDWQAYARTGHYSMKLYRDEVSPSVDLILDTSASMWTPEPKRRRTLELLSFCASSAARAGASLRCYDLADDSPKLITSELLRGCRADLSPVGIGDRKVPRLDQVPWRSGSLRVWISDLLFPGDPEVILNFLAQAKGRGVVLAPYSNEEADPDWLGNLEMESSEAPGPIRSQRVDLGLLARYRARYDNHFDLWRSSARRLGVRFAKIPSELDFRDALHTEAVPVGAVELRS